MKKLLKKLEWWFDIYIAYFLYNGRKKHHYYNYINKKYNFMGAQHVRLTIDENNLVTAVGENTKQQNSEYDTCVVCGKTSPYKVQTHIDYRIGYVEGAGQGCFQPKQCIQSNQSDRELLAIPKYLIEKYPNDMELGGVIREFYWNSKK